MSSVWMVGNTNHRWRPHKYLQEINLTSMDQVKENLLSQLNFLQKENHYYEEVKSLTENDRLLSKDLTFDRNLTHVFTIDIFPENNLGNEKTLVEIFDKIENVAIKDEPIENENVCVDNSFNIYSDNDDLPLAELPVEFDEKNNQIKSKKKKKRRKIALTKSVTTDETSVMTDLTVVKNEFDSAVEDLDFAYVFRMSENEIKSSVKKMECGKNSKFKCKICFSTFLVAARLKNHERMHDPHISGLFECELCRRHYKSQNMLTKHLKDSHTYKYVCKICPSVHFKRSVAKAHYNKHHIQENKKNKSAISKTFQFVTLPLPQEEQKIMFEMKHVYTKKHIFCCKLCGKSSKNKILHKQHMQLHEKDAGKLQCDVCNTYHRCKSSLTRHMLSNHVFKYKCTICTYTTCCRTTAKLHTKTHYKSAKTHKKTLKKTKISSKKPSDPIDYPTRAPLPPQEAYAMALARLEAPNYKFSPFKCNKCYRGFLDDTAFENHMKRHAPEAGEFVCDVCGLRYVSHRAIYKHMMGYHVTKYSCRFCPYVTSVGQLAKVHYNHHKLVTYKCPQCDKVSSKFSSHLTHIRTNHPSQYICNICANTYVSEKGLQKHRQFAHKDQANVSPGGGPSCESCSVTFNSEDAYRKHILITPKHQEERSFIENACKTCGQKFNNIDQLKEHTLTSHSKKYTQYNGSESTAFKFKGRLVRTMQWPTKCPDCTEILSNGNALWGHYRRIHPDLNYPFSDKPYVCEHCGHTFGTNSALCIHKRKHTGEKPYKCTTCNKTFISKLHLTQHSKNHSTERPFKCETCFRGFKANNQLVRHIRVHTGEKPYTCSLCNKRFADTGLRNSHVRVVHYREQGRRKKNVSTIPVETVESKVYTNTPSNYKL